MDRLEELVSRMNKSILSWNLSEVVSYIDTLVNECYIDEREAQHLLEDIINYGCTYSASAFKEVEQWNFIS